MLSIIVEELLNLSPDSTKDINIILADFFIFLYLNYTEIMMTTYKFMFFLARPTDKNLI